MVQKRHSGTVWEDISRLAARQHGVVARRQLRALGMTDARFDREIAGSRLHPIFRGVFAVGHRAIGSRGQMMAALLACGDAAVVSHGTAAALLDLMDRRPTLIDVIARGEAGRKIDGIRGHCVPPPDRSEIVIREGIASTNAARTIVDLAGIVGQRSLRRTVERAAVLAVLDIPAIDASLDRRPRRGAPVLRAILADWRENRAQANRPHLRSDLEARILALIAARGLPAPSCNQVIQADGTRVEVDMLWEPEKLIVEADGRRYHENPAAFERDRRRDRALGLSGYRVIRVTQAQVEDEPQPVIDAIGRLLAIR